MKTRGAGRFVVFAAACAAWLGAMLIWPESWAVLAAGQAWFINWSIQIAATLIAWTSPFSLPARYYQPFAGHLPAWMTRLPGLRFYKRVVLRLNPFGVDPGSPRMLDAAIDAAETTHAVTFGIAVALALLFALWGAIAVAAFLTLWNIMFNLYAIALQRQTRARLWRVATRRGRGRLHGPERGV